MNNQGEKKDANSNFHVCVRIRPTSSPSFMNTGHSDQIKYIRGGPENTILLVQPHNTQGDKVFIYDEVFDNKSNTKQIFDKVVLPNISDSLFKGFSHTILVYGMTGAGKTFTMFGENFEEATSTQPTQPTLTAQTVAVNLGSQTDLNNRVSSTQLDPEIDGPPKKSDYSSSDECKGGIVSETVKYVLANQSQSSKVKLKMSYLEIYNESIRDLLSTETLTSENLAILEDPDKGVYCPLLSEKDISNLDQISTFIKSGNKRRVMASTKMNQFSSRSHAIIQLSIEIEVANNGKTTTLLTPKLYMVDLAGSERAAATESKGVRFKEGANINKSLLSLGNCITVLSSSADKSKKHVPYRDSKLTRLLKESLGGNAKTLFIACVTPAFKFVEETINTLKYAQRAKSIQKDVYENVKQIYNNLDKDGVVKEMRSDIQNLKELLLQQQNDLLGINGGNLNIDEETLRQIQGISNLPPTEAQVLASLQYKTHRQMFQLQLKKLSDHFEDIIFRNRELECNLAEFNSSRDQNERLINEIMDTINPAALTQKEMKYRLDKVNTLRQIIKNNDDVILKLQKELQDNENMKNTIKKEIEDLYDVKFIQECQQQTNFQLISTFEQEKRKLKEEIQALVDNQQQRRDDEMKKESYIQNLREEINHIKKKATANEISLQQSQAELKRNRGRGKQLTLRASSIVNTNKITPRNIQQKDVASKYLNVQSYVPSSNISVSAVRGKSANIRNSIIGPSRKSELHISDNNNSQSVIQPGSMSEVNLSPTAREFEEYKRKEQIIGSQLKNMQKAQSQKNVSGSKTYVEIGSSSYLGQPTTSQSQVFSSPNRQSNNLFKSSYKSSFIDLAPSQSVENGTNYSSYDNSNGKNSYDLNRDNHSSDIDSSYQNDLNRRSELTHQQYQKIRGEEEEQVKHSSFNSNQFVSPKPINKVKQQYGLNSSGQSSAQQSKNTHSKNPSQNSDDYKSSIQAKESKFFVENSNQNQQQQYQSELLNPNQEFLFISQSQLANPQMKQLYEQQQRQNYLTNSKDDYSASKNMYQSPQGSNQKSQNSTYSSQKTPQQNNSQKNINNSSMSGSNNSTTKVNNSISSLYQNPQQPNSNDSPQKYANNSQQQAQMNKPSFNNYQQNNAGYGNTNQPAQGAKVPTTAITLNLGMK